MDQNRKLLNLSVGIVVFNNGPFGGAPKRYTNLFLFLNTLFPGKILFFVNRHLYRQIQEIYPDVPRDYIRIIDFDKKPGTSKSLYSKKGPTFYNGIIQDPDVIDRNTFLPRKVYWFLKNWTKQYILYRQIERYRKLFGIRVFVGVFSGILPLVFYLKQRKRKAAVIFSDMDSWFSDVISDMKKLWYRKYYSFNYALENSDLIDFLSPYVFEGVKMRGVKVKSDSIRIAPCSFIDYSNCVVGDKTNFEIAFSARLEPDKNPIMYLEAAKEILRCHPEIKFHLLGEGSLVNEIDDFIRQNNLETKINFQFHKNPKEVLKNTSVFVSIQSNTNYPSQSVLEAMSCGNAIIASNVADTTLFINDSNGILINPSAEDLVAALNKLINDKNLTMSLGLAGRNYVMKNHTIERYSDYFLKNIDDACEKIFV